MKRLKVMMGPKLKTKPNEVVKIKGNFSSVWRDPNTPPNTPPDSEIQCIPDIVSYDISEEGDEDPLSGSRNNDLGRKTSKDTFINENITETDGGFMCNPCDKLLTTKGGIARHVEDLHVNAGVRFQCPRCAYIAKNKNCLQSHCSRVHPGTKGFNYEQCALY